MQKEFLELENMLDARYPIVYLASPEYSRIVQTVRRIAFQKNYVFHTWDIAAGLQTHTRKLNTTDLGDVIKHPDHKTTKSPDGLLEEILKGKEEFLNKKEIFLLEDAHKYFNRGDKFVVLLRKLTHFLKKFNKHILLLSPFSKLPVEIEKYITVVNIPLPDKNDLETRLDAVNRGAPEINPDLKKMILDAAAGLTDTEADLAFRLAKVKTGLNSKDAIKAIIREKEQIIKKSGILDYYHVNEKMNTSVGGLDRLKEWLTLRKKSFERKAKKFGLTEPKGILLLGVPGTGKSLTAKSISQEWNQPLLKLDIGRVFQAEVGSSENNIRNAIATAEAVAPCILWIDEIEKGLSVGGGEKDGGTNSRVFSTILTWMQEKTKAVFVVATANNISNLPPELLRKGRFDEIFFVDLPTKKEREDIFRIHLKKYNQEKAITNFESILESTIHFNGAEIAEAVKEAMFIAYLEDSENPEISSAHLLQAIKATVPLAKTMRTKINKLREWAKTRARFASSDKNDEDLPLLLNDDKSKEEDTRTQREIQEDIF